MAHFVLTATTAVVSFVLGSRMNREAGRRQDARLFLVSLAFTRQCRVLPLHALVTPQIFVGRNTGFVIATATVGSNSVPVRFGCLGTTSSAGAY